jgi:hypothetical protein
MRKIQQAGIITSGNILWMTACSLWLLGSCVSIAPINSSFESAKTLGKGQIEYFS